MSELVRALREAASVMQRTESFLAVFEALLVEADPAEESDEMDRLHSVRGLMRSLVVAAARLEGIATGLEVNS
jgi:hypothetical protein